MGRLIDVDKLGLTDFEIVMCSGDYKEALKMLIEKIENAPTVDAVEVVRCKDCRWQITAYCPMPSWERKDNHYCYKGEREEDVDN